MKKKGSTGIKKRGGVFVFQFDMANSGFGAVVTVVGLSAEDHVHRGENPRITPSGQIVSGLEKHLMDIDGSLGRDSQGGEDSDDDVVPPVGDPAHLQAAPPGLRRRLSQIPLLNHNEPNLARRFGYVIVASEARQGVTPLNALDNLHVFGVVGAVLLGGDPLVRDVERTGLQNAEDFGVHLFELGRVTRGLDGVCAVEGVVGEGHTEEIAADDLTEGV